LLRPPIADVLRISKRFQCS